MDRKKILETVLAHELQQKCRAMALDGSCQYLTDDGKRCYIGALAPNGLPEGGVLGLASTARNGSADPRVVALFQSLDVNPRDTDDINWLQRLQNLHDVTPDHELRLYLLRAALENEKLDIVYDV